MFLDVEHKENVNGKYLSTYRGGGYVKYVVYPKTIQDIRKVLAYSKNMGLPFFILGKGSNILISDKGYNGIFISTKWLDKVSVYKHFVYCGSGISIKRLYNIALNFNLGGLESLATIPSSVGGMIKGNAGCYGSDISSLVTSIDVIDLATYEVRRKNRKDITFGYRSSDISELIIGANLSLEKNDKHEIINKYNECKNKRLLTQPKQHSIGCVFKNGENDSYKVAKLIDDLGLKGYSVGGAMVSLKHANFIVNTGSGTATDYLRVMEKISSRVLSEYGINLKREIQII